MRPFTFHSFALSFASFLVFCFLSIYFLELCFIGLLFSDRIVSHLLDLQHSILAGGLCPDIYSLLLDTISSFKFVRFI